MVSEAEKAVVDVALERRPDPLQLEKRGAGRINSRWSGRSPCRSSHKNIVPRVSRKLRRKFVMNSEGQSSSSSMRTRQPRGPLTPPEASARRSALTEMPCEVCGEKPPQPLAGHG